MNKEIFDEKFSKILKIMKGDSLVDPHSMQELLKLQESIESQLAAQGKDRPSKVKEDEKINSK